MAYACAVKALASKSSTVFHVFQGIIVDTLLVSFNGLKSVDRLYDETRSLHNQRTFLFVHFHWFFFHRLSLSLKSFYRRSLQFFFLFFSFFFFFVVVIIYNNIKKIYIYFYHNIQWRMFWERCLSFWWFVSSSGWTISATCGCSVLSSRGRSLSRKSDTLVPSDSWLGEVVRARCSISARFITIFGCKQNINSMDYRLTFNHLELFAQYSNIFFSNNLFVNLWNIIALQALFLVCIVCMK